MRSAYDAIYFELRTLIENGTYPYRSLLPSESSLVSQYGCAHNTVRKSLSILASEGYVQPVHGKGVRVIYLPQPRFSEKLESYPSSKIESFRKVSARNGLDGDTKVLLMENVKADDSLNLRYFPKDEPLVHVERVRRHSGEAYSFESNFFRADFVEGMTKADAEYSIYHYAQDIRGQRIVTSRRWMTMDPASKRDRELLDIDGVSHVAVIYMLAFDGDGLLCESSEIRLHPKVFLIEQTAIQTRVACTT